MVTEESDETLQMENSYFEDSPMRVTSPRVNSNYTIGEPGYFGQESETAHMKPEVFDPLNPVTVLNSGRFSALRSTQTPDCELTTPYSTRYETPLNDIQGMDTTQNFIKTELQSSVHGSMLNYGAVYNGLSSAAHSAQPQVATPHQPYLAGYAQQPNFATPQVSGTVELALLSNESVQEPAVLGGPSSSNHYWSSQCGQWLPAGPGTVPGPLQSASSHSQGFSSTSPLDQAHGLVDQQVSTNLGNADTVNPNYDIQCGLGKRDSPEGLNQQALSTPSVRTQQRNRLPSFASFCQLKLSPPGGLLLSSGVPISSPPSSSAFGQPLFPRVEQMIPKPSNTVAGMMVDSFGSDRNVSSSRDVAMPWPQLLTTVDTVKSTPPAHYSRGWSLDSWSSQEERASGRNVFSSSSDAEMPSTGQVLDPAGASQRGVVELMSPRRAEAASSLFVMKQQTPTRVPVLPPVGTFIHAPSPKHPHKQVRFAETNQRNSLHELAEVAERMPLETLYPKPISSDGAKPRAVPQKIAVKGVKSSKALKPVSKARKGSKAKTPMIIILKIPRSTLQPSEEPRLEEPAQPAPPVNEENEDEKQAGSSDASASSPTEFKRSLRMMRRQCLKDERYHARMDQSSPHEPVKQVLDEHVSIEHESSLPASSAASTGSPDASPVEPEVSVFKRRAGRPRKHPLGPRAPTAPKPRPLSPACWTCKLRRKRCDLVKPVCEACSKLGIECLGYDSTSRPDYMTNVKKNKAMRLRISEQVANNMQARKYAF